MPDTIFSLIYRLVIRSPEASPETYQTNNETHRIFTSLEWTKDNCELQLLEKTHPI